MVLATIVGQAAAIAYPKGDHLGLEDLNEIAADAVLAPGFVVSIEHIPSIKVMFGCRYGGKAS